MRSKLCRSFFICMLVSFIEGSVILKSALAQAKQAALNEITQAAVQSGALSCAGRINQVSSFLTANTDSGALIFKQGEVPDRELFSSSIEIVPSNNVSVYASASFAPNVVSGCAGVYDTVEYLDNACQDVEAKVLKGTTRIGVLKKGIVALSAGTVRFFLMPAGQGCVLIKKEIVS